MTTHRLKQDVACALLAMLCAFGICSHFSPVQDPKPGFVDLLYLGSGSGLLTAAVAVALFAAFRYLEREGSGKNDTPSLVLSFLFATAIVTGRSFTAESITYGSYGSFAVAFGSPQRCIFTLIVFAGLWISFAYGVRFVFFKLDSIRKTTCRPRSGRRREKTSTPEKPDPAPASRESFSTRIERLFELHPTWGPMLVFIICWLPYIVVFFPGTIYQDGAMQLRQTLGADAYSGHHPLFTTLILGAFVRAGQAVGSDSLGIFLYVILQAFALSYACAKIVGCVKELAPSHPWLPRITIAFFAIVPVWGTTVVSVKKDGLYFAAFALLLVACLQIANRKSRITRKDLLYLFALALIVSLVRNEGILVSIAMLLCLAAFMHVRAKPASRAKSGARPRQGRSVARSLGAEANRLVENRIEFSRNAAANSVDLRHPSRKIALQLVCTALCVLAVYGLGYRVALMGALDAKSGSISEALAIPLQQTARYYIEAPEDVGASIEDGVSRVLDTEGLNEDVYYPRNSDNIKFGYFKDDVDLSDLVAFASAYVEMGLRHPVLFAEAFIDQTTGWWYPEEYGDPDHGVAGMGLWQLTPAYDSYKELLDTLPVFWESGVCSAFMRLVDCFAYVPGIGLLVYPAIYVWMLAFLLFYLLHAGEKRKILMYVPIVLIVLICINSPVNGMTRYLMPAMMAMPALIAFALVDLQRGYRIGAERNKENDDRPRR